MQISQDIQTRIIEVAEQLHAQNPEKMPTVAEVRAASKANMNDVSIVMKQWRQGKLMPQRTIEEQAPNEVQAEALALASSIWATAKTQAEEKLRDTESRFNKDREESEQLRQELATECDNLQKNLENSNQTTAEAIEAQQKAELALEQALQQIEHLNQLKDHAEQQAALATAKNGELEKHITTLKADITTLKTNIDEVKTQAQTEKQQHTAALATVQTTIAERDNTITMLKTQLETTTQTKDADIARLTAENSDLKTTEKTLISKISDTEKALIQAKADTDIATTAAAQAQAHLQDLKTVIEKISPRNQQDGKNDN